MSMVFFWGKLNFHNKWMLVACVILIMHFLIGLALVMALNGKWINHSLLPIFQFTGMFSLIWPEQPFGALQFIATKSLFAFAHQDGRSGLNLWTLEYDTITLFIYVGVSILAGWILATYSKLEITRRPRLALLLTAAGLFFLSFSVSYMTVIEHCSGATWVGFVTLYGMGLDEFELYPAYQLITAIIGILALAWGLIQIKSISNTVQP